MLKSLEKKHIYFAGLLLVAIGLTLSPALMSIGQAVLVLNWLFDSEAGPRYSALWRNKTVVYFLLIFLVHVLGLAYTQNFEYAMKDLKIKLPLLLLPAVIGTSRVLEKRELHFVYYAVLASVFVSSLISFYLYLQMTVGAEDTLRNISPIISHIRLSLIACVAFFISLYFAWEYYTKNKLLFVGMLMYALWMLYFISILGARAGYLSILVASAFILFYKCIEYSRCLKYRVQEQ